MKWKDIEDNFGRRKKGNRRQKSTSGIESDRRSGSDRRNNPDRRGKADRRNDKDPQSVPSESYKKRSSLDRRDIIFEDSEQEIKP
jgi:hypothetical protein